MGKSLALIALTVVPFLFLLSLFLYPNSRQIANHEILKPRLCPLDMGSPRTTHYDHCRGCSCNPLPSFDAAIYLQVVLSMSLRLYQQQRLLQLLHQPHLVLQTRHLTPTQKSSNETFKPTWKSFPLCEEVPKLSSSDKEECFDTSARLRELLPQNAISASSRSSGFRTKASSFHLAPYES